MKISKVEHLENTEPIESDLENENIQLDIDKPVVEKKKRVYKKKVFEPTTEISSDIEIQNPPEPKPKRTMSEAQLWNWSKCIQAREANRLKRKEDKQQQEEQKKADLENKIIIKAKRIKKAQSKVLGNLDELNEDVVEIPKVAKKQKIKKVVIYKSESENESDYEEEKVVQKPKVAKKQIPAEPVQQQLKHTIVRAIQFVWKTPSLT